MERENRRVAADDDWMRHWPAGFVKPLRRSIRDAGMTDVRSACGGMRCEMPVNEAVGVRSAGRTPMNVLGR